MKYIKHSIFALLCALVVVTSSLTNLLYQLDNMAADKIYQTPQALNGTVRILGIDEIALEGIGPFPTWTRGNMADIINALNSNPDHKPAAIGIDVMYFGDMDAEGDKALAEACKKYGNVVVGSNITFDETVVINDDGSYFVDDFHVSLYEEPYEELKKSARYGLVNTMPDYDGIMRSNTHFVDLPDGTRVNSFAYEIYRTYAEAKDLPLDINPPLNENQQFYINYSGYPGDFYDGSVMDLLNGNISPEMFEDAIVLIGPYATGMLDSYVSAIDHTIPMYGVEIHANILQALLDQNFKEHIPVAFQCILAFIILFLSYFGFKNLKPVFSTPLAVAIITAYLGLAYILGLNGLMIKVIYVPIGVGLLYFTWLAINYVRESLEKKKVKDTFKKYVAPTVVDEIFKNQDNLKLGGEKREIACMFVDIRGFTPMSEALSPEQVVEMLNQYLDLTSNAVFKHQGMLDKFIGDATMALYNAPLDLDDYVYKSVLTAWDIVKGGDELGKTLLDKYGRTVSFGIGLNCGPAVIGNIGTNIRMDYTAIGDTVNTAARLESQAKPGQVLLSESIYEAVKDRIQAVPLGEISLKGKSKGVRVYGLQHINEFTNTQEPLKTASEMPGKDAVSYGGNS